MVSLLFKTLSRFDSYSSKEQVSVNAGIILNNTKLPIFNHFNLKKKMQFNVAQTSRKHVA